jgi:hypothetical protein
VNSATETAGKNKAATEDEEAEKKRKKCERIRC